MFLFESFLALVTAFLRGGLSVPDLPTRGVADALAEKKRLNLSTPVLEMDDTKMPFSTRLKYALILILAVVVVSAGTFWATKRIDTHREWALMMSETQRFRGHMQTIARLLNGSFQANITAQRWLSNEFSYAYTSLFELRRLDEAHWSQLDEIQYQLESKLNSYRIFSSNFTEHQSTIAGYVRDVGEKVVSAYWEFSQNISVGMNGPSFWYIGPSPPDEAILHEAIEAIVNATKLLPP